MKIFISYCWKNEKEVDVLDESFLNEGVTLIRDKRSTEYKDSFKEFMKNVRVTDYVLMVISREYLQSKNCMFEVLEVLKDDNYKDRIFPILLDSANSIYSPEGRLVYLEFWKTKYEKLKSMLSDFSPEETISVSEELRILRNINGTIVDFLSLISDLKNIPFAELSKTNFVEIKLKLGIEPKDQNQIRYDILDQEDVSHSGAKRYSARVIIDSKYSKNDIKKAIYEITEQLKNSSYHKNSILEHHFKNRKADVVWLFIANRLSDVKNANWVCRTMWINPKLDEKWRPLELSGNDTFSDIIIDWNNQYDEMVKFYDGYFAPKGIFLQKIDELVSETQALVKPLFDLFKSDLLNNQFQSTIDFVKTNKSKMDEIYHDCGDVPMPPYECQKLDGIAQKLFSIASNLFLYFSEKGLTTWNIENVISLFKDDMLSFIEVEKQIEFERAEV